MVRSWGHAVFTAFVNALCLPAIAIPAGHTADGLPVGFQIVGRRGSDHTCLPPREILRLRSGRYAAAANSVAPQQIGAMIILVSSSGNVLVGLRTIRFGVPADYFRANEHL